MTTGYFLTRDVWVWASDRAVIRHVLHKLRPEVRYSREARKHRHRTLRDALRAHHDHQRLCRRFCL